MTEKIDLEGFKGEVAEFSLYVSGALYYSVKHRSEGSFLVPIPAKEVTCVLGIYEKNEVLMEWIERYWKDGSLDYMSKGF